ncbi:NADH-quinone oxidoreductase subunit A [Streptomyces roseoviridis]|uniref:NADH-quinone oxidoreductase subunit A n=1 Tax=Streptomyces roseoviridis TaxID=67361 RepID=UPI0031EF0E18
MAGRSGPPAGKGDHVEAARWEPVATLLAVALIGVFLLHCLGAVVRTVREPLHASPFSGGLEPQEHPVSRFHVRWYPVTMIFLAFDMEMLFMYPWTKVVPRIGTPAVVEMFLFLGILLAGVGYAWREGAFRWT